MRPTQETEEAQSWLWTISIPGSRQKKGCPMNDDSWFMISLVIHYLGGHLCFPLECICLGEKLCHLGEKLCILWEEQRSNVGKTTIHWDSHVTNGKNINFLCLLWLLLLLLLLLCFTTDSSNPKCSDKSNSLLVDWMCSKLQSTHLDSPVPTKQLHSKKQEQHYTDISYRLVYHEGSPHVTLPN
jgi:hypothetical protein